MINLKSSLFSDQKGLYYWSLMGAVLIKNYVILYTMVSEE